MDIHCLPSALQLLTAQQSPSTQQSPFTQRSLSALQLLTAQQSPFTQQSPSAQQLLTAHQLPNQNQQDLIVYTDDFMFELFENRWKSSNEVMNCEVRLVPAVEWRGVLTVNRSTLRRLKICGVKADLLIAILDFLRSGPLIQLEIDTLELLPTNRFSLNNVFNSLRVLSIDSVRVVNEFELEIGSPTFAFNAPNLTTVYLGECRGI